MLSFPGLCMKIFTVCPWMVRTPSFYHSDPQMLSLTPELSQKNSKKLCFEQTFKHSLNYESLPPLISGLNSKFDNATVCVLNWGLLSQNFVLKSYLYQKLLRKNLWGSAPPLRSGRVNPLKGCLVLCVVLLHFAIIQKLLNLKTLDLVRWGVINSWFQLYHSVLNILTWNAKTDDIINDVISTACVKNAFPSDV